MKKRKDYIFIKRGLVQPLQNIPYHMKAPLKRILMQDDSTFPNLKKILPGSNYHIAVHIVSKLPKKILKYVEPHAHNCDEINLLLSESGKLTYKFWVEGKTYIVSSPATVYIPRGIKHTAEVIKGKGIYVCIVMSKNYITSLLRNKDYK